MEYAQMMDPFWHSVCDMWEASGTPWGRTGNMSHDAAVHAIRMAEVANLLQPEGVVLDVGGGPGEVAKAMADKCYRWILVEPHEKTMAHAKENVTSPNVEFVNSDVESWLASQEGKPPFLHRVLFAGSIHYLPTPETVEKVIGQISALMLPRAIMAISQIPDAAVYQRAFAGMTKEQLEEVPEPTRRQILFPATDLMRMLRTHGLVSFCMLVDVRLWQVQDMFNLKAVKL